MIKGRYKVVSLRDYNNYNKLGIDQNKNGRSITVKDSFNLEIIKSAKP